MAGQSDLLTPGVFHPLTTGAARILAEAAALKILLAANPTGLKEQALLRWFGECAERITLFPLGLRNQSYVAQYIAREITIKNFRADFACLYISPTPFSASRLLLIETQGALPNSVFQRGRRMMPLWSSDFLKGFAQVVDWHCFKDEIDTWPPLTQVVAGHGRVDVDFAVIAGLNANVADALSQKRLRHWREHVGLGNNLHISTFDALPLHAETLLNSMKLLTAAPSVH
jgi:hypothetical protein